MQLPASDRARRWRVVAGGVSLLLLLMGMALIPPGTLPFPPKAIYSDAQVSHWPNAFFLRQTVLENHAWPFWNPMRMLGQPFAANPLTKVWYPPQWLVFILPPTAHLDLLIYLHLAWLGAGMVTWAHSERLRMLTALFMALAWGLNPKLIGHLGAGHLDILYALSWAPWLMWAVRRFVTRPGAGRGVFLGAILALLALADIRMAVYFTPLALIYGLSILPGVPQPGRALIGGAVALTTLALLTAVQTLPVLALGPYLTRAAISPQDAAEFSLSPRYLLGLVLPDVGGQHEFMTALGLPVVVLAFYSLRSAGSRRRALVWWGVSILAFLWALGSFGPLFLPTVRLIPALTWLRIPSRAWFVIAFSMIVLAGQGLEMLLACGPGRWGRLAAMALVSAGLSGLAAAILVPQMPGIIAGSGGALVGTGAGLWVSGIVATPVESTKPPRAAWIGAAMLLATLALSLVGLDLTLVVPRSMADIEGPEQAIIGQLDPGCLSVYSPTFEMVGPATIASGVVTLHGVDPFELRGSAQLIAAAAGVSLRGYSIIAPPLPPGETDLTHIQPRLDLLRMAGVCDIVSSSPLSETGLQPPSHSGSVSIYGLTDSSEHSAGPQPLIWRPRVVGFDKVTTQVCPDQAQQTPLTVVIPQSWAPGWQAWVDGNQAQIQSDMDGAMLAIPIDSMGCHTLALAYRPLPDLAGLIISGLTAVALTGGWLFSRRRSNHA